VVLVVCIGDVGGGIVRSFMQTTLFSAVVACVRVPTYRLIKLTPWSGVLEQLTVAHRVKSSAFYRTRVFVTHCTSYHMSRS
jgi:hypothetical protein